MVRMTRRKRWMGTQTESLLMAAARIQEQLNRRSGRLIYKPFTKSGRWSYTSLHNKDVSRKVILRDTLLIIAMLTLQLHSTIQDCNTSLNDTVYGVENTVILLKTHFESLLNSVTTDANMQNAKQCVQNTEHWCDRNNLLITPCMYKMLSTS